MGTLKRLAQRTRERLNHTALPMLPNVRISAVTTGVQEPTWNCQRGSVSGGFHDTAQKHRDIVDLTVLEHWRVLMSSISVNVVKAMTKELGGKVF